LRTIDRTEVKSAFGHWIEQCQWVAANKRQSDPAQSITAFGFFSTHAHICQYVRCFGHPARFKRDFKYSDKLRLEFTQ
jgi:hypothetical protein